jgi:hypothetical protein
MGKVVSAVFAAISAAALYIVTAKILGGMIAFFSGTGDSSQDKLEFLAFVGIGMLAAIILTVMFIVFVFKLIFSRNRGGSLFVLIVLAIGIGINFINFNNAYQSLSETSGAAIIETMISPEEKQAALNKLDAAVANLSEEQRQKVIEKTGKTPEEVQSNIHAGDYSDITNYLSPTDMAKLYGEYQMGGTMDYETLIKEYE